MHKCIFLVKSVGYFILLIIRPKLFCFNKWVASFYQNIYDILTISRVLYVNICYEKLKLTSYLDVSEISEIFKIWGLFLFPIRGRTLKPL